MLQVQKLWKLEEVEVTVEEGPEGEAIVGSSWEVLRPPGICTNFHPDKFPLCLSVFGKQAPLLVLYIGSSFVLWLLGQTSEEEEGETEKPETSTQEQARFDWACIWMEERVCQHWQRVRLRDYLLRYFSL